MSLKKMTKEQLSARIAELTAEYEGIKAKDLKLDMSRGKPGADQLDLTMELLDSVNLRTGYKTKAGFDVRNYGLVDGIPEAKELFAEVFELMPEQVIVCGNSSLNLMFDYISMAYSHGVGGCIPWSAQENVKFICPVPGYDRHFAVTEFFGIEMVTVPMTAEGPDMDEVERLAADPSFKGIWCVPMYSNPSGITYSDEVVRRLAAMKCAPDFRIIWDNAYCLHHLNADAPDKLLNLYKEAEKLGNENRVVMVASTSKVSFPGAGVAAIAGSPETVAQIKKRMSIQTIGHDKINMLRHTRYFENLAGFKEHMKLHAAVLRPKFAAVLDCLQERLGGKEVGHWNAPCGGYFVAIDLMEGCASETVQMLAEAGVVMTPAGATYPHGNDPKDSNLRIAPTFPPVEELKIAMELFCICAELVCAKKLLG